MKTQPIRAIGFGPKARKMTAQEFKNYYGSTLTAAELEHYVKSLGLLTEESIDYVNSSDRKTKSKRDRPESDKNHEEGAE